MRTVSKSVTISLDVGKPPKQ
jgi:hypothetical protein